MMLTIVNNLGWNCISTYYIIIKQMYEIKQILLIWKNLSLQTIFNQLEINLKRQNYHNH